MQGLARTITSLRATGLPVHTHLGAYQAWARTVARYSFETYRAYTDTDAV